MLWTKLNIKIEPILSEKRRFYFVRWERMSVSSYVRHNDPSAAEPAHGSVSLENRPGGKSLYLSALDIPHSLDLSITEKIPGCLRVKTSKVK